MCHIVRLITRAWKNRLRRLVYAACHPRKNTTYILHVVLITTHTHNRRKSSGKKKQRRERKGNGCMGPKKRKEKYFWGGLLASLPPERDVTWFFDGLQQ